MQYDPSKKKKPEEKLKPVIKQGATLKKRTVADKATSEFKEDAMDALEYASREVVKPMIKTLLFNAVMGTLGMYLWKDNYKGKPTGFGGFGGFSNGGTNYNGISSGIKTNNNGIIRAGSSANGFDYDKIRFASPGEAELVLDSMRDALERGYIVTVESMYDLANVTNNNYMAGKYGWDDLSGAKVVPTFDGWCLRLPKPKYIE